MQHTAKLKKAPAYRFVVFIEMLLCYILIYAGIQMVATLGGEIMAYLNVAEGKLGVFSAIGNPAMAVMSVLAGALTSRFGGKKVLVAGLFVMAISGALYLTGTKSLAFLIVIRLIQGFGTGMVSATLMALVAVWFPVKERGTAHGLLACFYGASTSVVNRCASERKSNLDGGCFIAVTSLSATARRQSVSSGLNAPHSPLVIIWMAVSCGTAFL